jgi:cytochrome c5
MGDKASVDRHSQPGKPAKRFANVAWWIVAALALPALSQQALAQGSNRSGARDATNDRSGEQIVAAQCAKCHISGEGGAPKIGDRAAWTPRMKQGLDLLVRSAIKGHGGMPARGGMADTTDAEIRSAVLYMFDPESAVANESQQKPGGMQSAVAPAKPGGKRLTVGGMDVYLGLVPAEALRAYPQESVERSMHGGVPGGTGRYHVNVSLFDVKSGGVITDAQVDALIEEPGMSSESKKLEPMVINKAASYGNYFKMAPKTSYSITVRVQRSGSPLPVEVKFDQRTN